jgi:hypothetical protein
MEAPIGWLRWSGDAIHAITHHPPNYYMLSDLGRVVGLGRRNACNLLWNLYVFSAAFLEMDTSGF